MHRGIYRVMDISEIKQRLELALSPAERPTLEEVFEQVSRHGVLRGPVDWVFPAWRLYVNYVVKEIVGGFKLSTEEEDQLRDFSRRLNTLLEQAERQAKAKLTSIYRATTEDAYRLEGRRLYAPNDWMYVGRTMYILVHGISAETYFPDVLKLPQVKLELLQLGWRASDEGELDGRPFMNTTRPWQVFAWTAARYGELYIRVDSVNLTREGASVMVRLKANSWRQRWSKAEAIDLVASHLRRGEWMPLLTMWLGDGKAERKKVLRGDYKIVIAAKEPWRLGSSKSTRRALVATGKEAFVKLRDAAGIYGVLLDRLRAHKWVNIKLATDDNFKAVFKQKGIVTVEGVAMHLHLVSGSLLAEHYTRDVGKALEIADKLKAAGLRPNVVKSGPNYVVYIATADLLRLAERDEAIRKAIALYLTEKAKNGTPRQREIAKKILKRNPLFSSLYLC